MDIATRCAALLARRGYGPETDTGDGAHSDGEDALPLIQSAAVVERPAVRHRRATRRVQLRGERPHRFPPLCATGGGDTRCGSDRTTAHGLMAEERVALVPPPRASPVFYGARPGWTPLASRHRWHRAVRARPPRPQPAASGIGPRLTKAPRGRSRQVPWSTLLWRAIGVVAAAGSWVTLAVSSPVMTLRAVARGPDTGRVLEELERAAQGPPERAADPAGA